MAAVVVEAPSGRVVHVNARARELERHLHRRIPSELGSGWEIFHPDGRPYRTDEWPLVRSITTGEEVVNEDYFNVLADGSRLFVRCSSMPIYDDGQIVGGLLVMEDVTQHKRAEEALIEAQRRSETILESITDAFVAVDREWRYTYLNERALASARAAHGEELTSGDMLGKNCWDAFPELVGTTFDERLHTALGEQRVVQFDAYSPRTDRWLEVHAYPSRDGLSVYSRDISERRWGQEEIGRRVEQQALVAGLGLQALASDDLDSLMREAMTLVAGALDVGLTGIAELLPGGGAIRMSTGSGWNEGVVGDRTEAAAPDSQWGYTLAAAAPVVSEDLGSDRRFAASAVALEHGAVSGAGVVIQATERPFGVLEALSTTRRSFSDSDVNTMQAVANVLATAIRRVEYESRILEVRDNERRRIARDLHDEALQDLTDVIAQASTAVPGAGDAEQRLARLAPALKRVGSQLRGAIYDLRLAGEESRPFPELLTALVELQRAMSTDCDIELELGAGAPSGPLGKSGTEILRIVAETIINARRHSNARRIRVVAAGSAKHLSVEISDDGRGFDTAATPTAAGGSGIEGMRERAGLLDGDLEITSEPGAGTRVRLSVPLSRGHDTADETVRVLLVEDHTAVREAIAAQFEREPGFDVVGQAASLAEARALLDEHIDVAVVDLGLPDGNGSDLIKDLRHAHPRAEALVLSASLDRAQTAHAIESGASATLDKTAHLDEVVDAVRRLRAGETLLDLDEVIELLRFAGSRRAQEREHHQAIESLTPREHEVLQALADGLNSQTIADRLHITTRTQRNHVANILTKLGVHSQLQAVLLALRYDIVKPH
jgi:DNA-binding NarL/FixJ family response regulator/signal transduction histidine kinase